MNVTTKKTFFYFFKTAQKTVGLCVALCALIIGEFLILDPDFQMEGAAQRFSGYIMMLYMIIQAAWGMYAISYYDSLIMSFGAKRKDVFVGEILREMLTAIEITIMYVILQKVGGGETNPQNALIFMVVGLAAGAIMRIVGGLNLKHGRLVYLILILGCALLGGVTTGYQAATGKGLLGFGFFASPLFPIIGLCIYIVLQYPLHRIYRTVKVY